MKKTLFTLVLTALLPACAFADVTKEEIRRLVAAGISEQTILTYIRQNGPVCRLSADDLVELKAAGAGDCILKELVAQVAVPDADLPILAPAPAPNYGAFGNVYVYDTTYRSCLPARTRPVRPLCDWGTTFTTIVPRCAPVVVCRPAPVCHPVPVCRPEPCRPVIRHCSPRR